jgi:hypothetical protein
MKKVKLTFSIPEDVAAMLEQRIPKRQRNNFITEAIHARFNIMEQEGFLREVAAANREQDENLTKIDACLDPEDAELQSDELDEDEILELDDL